MGLLSGKEAVRLSSERIVAIAVDKVHRVSKWYVSVKLCVL